MRGFRLRWSRRHTLPSPTFTTETSIDEERLVERWHLHGSLHRDEGPAETWYRADLSVACERWYKHGEQHREGEAAEIQYQVGGEVQYQGWWCDGVKHRADGPAELRHQQGVAWEAWFWYGRRLEHDHEIAAMILMEAYRVEPSLVKDARHPELALAAFRGGVRMMPSLLTVLRGTPVEWVAAYDDSQALP